MSYLGGKDGWSQVSCERRGLEFKIHIHSHTAATVHSDTHTLTHIYTPFTHIFTHAHIHTHIYTPMHQHIHKYTLLTHIHLLHMPLRGIHIEKKIVFIRIHMYTNTYIHTYK